MFITFSILPLLVIPLFDYFYSSSKWLYLYALAFILINLFIFLPKKFKFPKPDKNRFIIFVILGLLFAASVFSNSPIFVYPVITHFLLGLIFFLISFNSYSGDKEESLDKVAKFNLIGTSVVLLVCLFQLFKIPGLEFLGIDPGQFGATLGNPNFLGEYLGLSIIIQIFSLNKKRSSYKKLKIIFLLLSLVVIYITHCRSALLALMIALIFTYLGLIKKYWKKSFLIMSILAFLIFVTSSLSEKPFFPIKSGSNKARFIRYVNSLYMVKDRPFFGFGPDKFLSAYLPFKEKYKNDPEISQNVLEKNLHSTYLEIMVEYGPLFLVLLLGLMVNLFIKIWNGQNKLVNEDRTRKFLLTLYLFVAIEIAFSFALKRPTFYFMVCYFLGTGVAFIGPSVLEMRRRNRIFLLPLLYLFFNFGFKKGVSHYNYFKYSKYIGSMEEACNLWPYNTRYCLRKGELELIQGDLPQAVKTFQYLLKYHPHFYPALGSLGVAYLREGKFKEGCHNLKKYKKLMRKKTKFDFSYLVNCKK